MSPTALRMDFRCVDKLVESKKGSTVASFGRKVFSHIRPRTKTGKQFWYEWYAAGWLAAMAGSGESFD